MSGRTVSERAFEEYLAGQGIVGRYEELPTGITTPADYTIELAGQTIRFDVKEWQPQEPVTGISHLDPYGPVRDKVEAGRAKFKQYKGRGEACVVVLCHYGPQLILLDSIAVLGAMQGDIGWVFPVDTTTGIGDASQTRQAFLKGGSMVHHAPNGRVRTQNTTISAIAVLGSFDVAARKGDLEFRRRELAADHELSIKERWRLAESVAAQQGKPHLELRVAVYDNLDAAVPLTSEFPSGPCDERFGRVDDRIRRVYVGNALSKFERDEEILGISREDPLRLR